MGAIYFSSILRSKLFVAFFIFGFVLGRSATLLAQLNFIGSATLEAGNPTNCIQITPLSLNQVGWVYCTQKLDLTQNQSLEFSVYLGNNDAGGDGITFVLQNDTRDFNARGCDGFRLGYRGCPAASLANVSPSVAVEIDILQNVGQNDPANDHLAFQQNGTIAHPAVFDGYIIPTNIEDGLLHRFKFEWIAASNTVNVYWENMTTPVLTRVINIPTVIGTTQARWGWTGATGSSAQSQQYFCSDAGVTLNTGLPVRWLSFQGTAGTDNVRLEWTTASESNSDYFVVERSGDGQQFAAIGQVKAAGNSQTLRRYTATDESPERSINYYRLRQVDFDGTFSYSTVIAVEMMGDSDVLISPNPVARGGTLRLPEALQGQIRRVQLCDMRGGLLFGTAITDSDTSLPLPTLPAGVYLLTLHTASRQYTQRVVVY